MAKAKRKDHLIPSSIHENVDNLSNVIISTYGNSEGVLIGSDRELHELTGMSRGKLRESLAVLVYNGLLESFWGKGRYIKKPLTKTNLQEVS